MSAKGRCGSAGNATQTDVISAHMAITASDAGNMNGARIQRVRRFQLNQKYKDAPRVSPVIHVSFNI